MKRLSVLCFIFITALAFCCTKADAKTFDFSKTGNEKSNKIFKEFMLEELPEVRPDLVSYFCDIDSDGTLEIIAIIKSNMFHTLQGYNLLVLRPKTSEFIKTDVFFDNSQPLEIEDSHIFYYAGDLYDNKRFEAEFVNNQTVTYTTLSDKRKHKQIKKIQRVTEFDIQSVKNEIPLNDLKGSEQKNIRIKYNNLDPKVKHYLYMK